MSESPTVRQRRLGAELRRLREAADVSMEEAARALECTHTKISRIETGHRGVRPLDLRVLLDLYGVRDEATRGAFAALARESRRKDWWSSYSHVLATPYRDFIGLEERATVVRAFHTQLVHGLLQTEDYAREVIRATRIEDDASDIDNLVQVKMARQSVLSRPEAPRFTLVLDESVLRRPIGSAAVMRGQLEHLVRMSRTKNVIVQVLPYAAGAHTGLEGSFTVMDFQPTERALVYLESLTGGLYIENPDDVQRYEQAFENLRAEASSARASRDSIQAIARELP